MKVRQEKINRFVQFFDIYIKKEIGRDFQAPQKFIGEVEG